MSASRNPLKSSLGWMIDNPIATNLLTIFIILCSILSFPSIKQETSPSFYINEIEISASYPGATAQDIEQSIVFALEQLFINHSYVEQLSAQIEEGQAKVVLSLHDWVSTDIALNQIKNELDRVSTFPKEMEPLVVSLAQEQDSLIEIGLHGDVSQETLYQQTLALKNAMLVSLDISKISNEGQGTPEIVIEFNDVTLRQYQLTLEGVVTKIKSSLSDVPVGAVSTYGGDVLIRTLGRKNRLSEFKNIAIVTHNNESILLGKLATLHYQFGDNPQPFKIDSQPGVALVVYQDTMAKPIALSSEIVEFIGQYKANIPPQLSLTVLQDEAQGFKERIALLTENGLVGMALIMLILALFVDARLAFWVSLSIPVAIVGALGLMPLLNLPINMITLFSFIITLGILVDDSVVVAENIHQKIRDGVATNKALKEGVGEMAMPVVISVLTNMIAFLPLLFVPGELGVMYKPMTLLIFAIFFVSLVEALLILPHHLSGLGKPTRDTFFARWQLKSFQRFDQVKYNHYRPLLKKCMRNPAIVLALFLSATTIIFSWTLSDRIGMSFVPKIESTRIDAEIEFPSGMPYHQRLAIVEKVELAGHQAIDNIGGHSGVKYVMQDLSGSEAQITFRLVSDSLRQFSALTFVNAWRTSIGDVAGVKSIFFDYQVGPGGGQEIVIELGHKNANTLALATKDMMKKLTRVSGVADVDSALIDGKTQYNLTVNQLGRSLGFDSDSLGREVRLRFFGDAAHRQILQGDEVKVRVRMSKREQGYANRLHQLILIAPNGQEVELAQIANISQNLAVTTIERRDGQQFVEVTGSILRQTANATAVMNRIESDLVPTLAGDYDGLSVELGGSARIESKVNSQLIYGVLLALALIYSILAIYFKSYFDPLLVLLVIPFCLSAALLGHSIMGADLSVMSLFGMIALAGLVINGAFVMLVQINQAIDKDVELLTAIEQAALSRFRPIVITAVTTAIGLIPLLFETSTQALYLIPMVISLSFGTVFSMVIILLLSPALFVMAKKRF